MKKNLFFAILLALILSIGITQNVTAQTYLFSVPQYEVEAYLNADGTLSLYYYMVFANDKKGDPLDYIDLGLPSTNYDIQSITATINDLPISGIGNSAYVSGIELPLQSNAIQPGNQGTVIVQIPLVRNIIFPYDSGDRENYVNFQFTPNYFGSEFDKSKSTAYRITIILPPGVGANEGVYYEPETWPGSETPEAQLTEDGRVYYSWYTENANLHTQYLFGVAFPKDYIDPESIITKDQYIPGIINSDNSSGNFFGDIFNNLGEFFPCCCFGGFFIAIFGFSIYQSTIGAKKRKLAYLPPKIAIEGHGIKRGLTAVEAAVVMEQPMDKILTMIMFSTIKKNAATVIEREPLKLEISNPLPENLHSYELGFLAAFKEPSSELRRKSLQSVMVDLVKTTSTKMKGFSRNETLAYYKDIMEKAWKMVEEADTPEVKSEKYDRTLEWTMLDREFDDRTRRTFTGMPVFLPGWWGRYDPVYRQTTSHGIPRPSASTTSSPVSGGASRPSLSLPNIPGSDFAASVINGTAAMAGGIVGNLTDFTSGVTTRTNPIPIRTSSSSGSGGFRGSGGGHSCACACACAGCACACAGGGR